VEGEDFVLPDRAVMLHIGPHKTGTTTIQGALHNSRERLLAQDVRYAGKDQQMFLEARTAVGTRGVPGRRPPSEKAWRRLVREVAESPQGRVIVSSEGYAGADDAAAARVVGEFGSSRPVHVVVTLRPLTKIVPSQWQQFTQNGQRRDYEDWLGIVFRESNMTTSRTFWRRHDHGALVERWAAVVGPENLTVIVVDETDREMLLRVFERLVGVSPGTLVGPTVAANRSLTAAEIELVRRVNLEIGDEEWAKEAYSQVMKDGVSDAMQINRKPGPDEIPITTPRWAIERAAEVGAEFAQTIRSLDVRVVGDLDRISDLPPESAVRPDDAAEPTDLPLDAAVLAVIGAVHGMEEARSRRTPLPQEVRPEPKPLTPADFPARALVRSLAGRGVKRMKRRLPGRAS
jgi:hypothetical protein